MHRKTIKHLDVPRHSRFLTFSCYRRQPLLSDPRLCRAALKAINAARSRHRFELWAFVVMPSHIHLLLLPPDDHPSVSAALKSIKQPIAALALEIARHRAADTLDRVTTPLETRRFWQRGPGFDRNLWSPRTIWSTIDYIHRNPTEAGLCRTPQEWPWSSAAAFLHGPSPPPLRLNHHRLPRRPVQHA